MKQNIKLWLFFGFFFLFGACSAAGLRYAYGLTLLTGPESFLGESLSFHDYVRLTCHILKPLTLVFLSSFTLFACATGGTACLAAGIFAGQTAMGYGLSPLNPFTHGACLIFLLGYGALFTVLASLSALHRSSLTHAAPDLKLIVRDKRTHSLLYNFLAVAATSMAVSAALYFFLFYFPL